MIEIERAVMGQPPRGGSKLKHDYLVKWVHNVNNPPGVQEDPLAMAGGAGTLTRGRITSKLGEPPAASRQPNANSADQKRRGSRKQSVDQKAQPTCSRIGHEPIGRRGGARGHGVAESRCRIVQ